MKNQYNRNISRKNSSQPANKVAALAAMIFAVSFGVIWISVAAIAGAPKMFLLFGGFVVVMIVINVIVNILDMGRTQAGKTASGYKGNHKPVHSKSYSTKTAKKTNTLEKPDFEKMLRSKLPFGRRKSGEADPWDDDFRQDTQEFNIDPACGHIHPVKKRYYCPSCGISAKTDYQHCSICGERLREEHIR